MKFIKQEDVTGDMVLDIGFNLRESDEIEVQLSHGMSGLNACMDSYCHSSMFQVFAGDDGTPVGITGMWHNSIWLLATDGLTATKSHRWQLCTLARQWVDLCVAEVGETIGNYAYSENKKSLKWLKHLGFTVGEPEPYGVKGALFCPFWRSPS
tara:strand:- start:186 stop:644 length:459 start_codon:yes stop_codon:yes gene_type:complete